MKTTNKEVNKGHQVKIEAQITEGINDINDINDLIQKGATGLIQNIKIN